MYVVGFAALMAFAAMQRLGEGVDAARRAAEGEVRYERRGGKTVPDFLRDPLYMHASGNSGHSRSGGGHSGVSSVADTIWHCGMTVHQ